MQGVFFRASTASEAQRLGLRGRALNLPDGRVEVLAIGSADAVAALGDWLHRGPRLAKVSRVESAVEDPGGAGPAGAVYDGLTVRVTPGTTGC